MAQLDPFLAALSEYRASEVAAQRCLAADSKHEGYLNALSVSRESIGIVLRDQGDLDGLFGQYGITECGCYSGAGRIAGNENGYCPYYLNQRDSGCYYFPAFDYINHSNSNDLVRTYHCRPVFRSGLNNWKEDQNG